MTDHLNSIRDLAEYNSGTDETTIALHRVFDAFGNETSSTGSAECLFEHTGTLRDAATGLDLHGIRWYEPSTARWASEDHIGDGTNLYAYVGNNPTTNTDSTGYCKDDGGGYSDLVYRGEAGSYIAAPFRYDAYSGLQGWSYANFRNLVYRGENMGIEAAPFRLGAYNGQQMWAYANYSNLVHREEAFESIATPFRQDDYAREQQFTIAIMVAGGEIRKPPDWWPSWLNFLYPWSRENVETFMDPSNFLAPIGMVKIPGAAAKGPLYHICPSAIQRFSSFSALKRALGSAGKGNVWHHIVEQTPGNIVRFGSEAIHNTQNVIRVSVAINQRIANYYSSIRPFTGGKTVRAWLATQSLEAQETFGLRILQILLSGGTLP
ncbi:MAG: RHS repeat-associated core domain-containing protein [Pirellulaceae bacterium]|nr:RHS repeat-associated core domain-containing protein [Pirellulaceae bacterium]